ncbi:arginine repressor [Nigerium massiliense]|uniref:arginine repressor n=1 Tax=Nigerium massiliense TaxID=1522317 RepID=UPI00058AC321|nr:arginine repressor [Nigerium massiliense]
MNAPQTKAARQARIAALLNRSPIRSQGELATLLRDEGFTVTQGTLSRDLVDVGALRVRGADGELAYALAANSESPGSGGSRAKERLHRLCGEVLVGAEASSNLVVVKTPPGAAQYLASAIDRVGWDAVLGTIAGDDSILIVTRDPEGGAEVAAQLVQISRSEG